MVETKTHPAETELADFLADSISRKDKDRLIEHLADCEDCLCRIAAAYDAVRCSGKNSMFKKRKGQKMKRINYFLILAIISFALSFLLPRYFIQFLVATLLLGIKWVTDSKTTKMLIMIHEAWKRGGGEEVSRMVKKLDRDVKNRL